MKNPTHELIPRWYEIGMKNKDTLLIRIHKKALYLLGKLKPDSPIVVHTPKALRIPEFIFPTEKKWGFGEVLEKEEESKEWVSYNCRLPIVDFKGDDRSHYAVRATLQVLFIVLSFPDRETDCSMPQLIWIEGMGVEERIYGATIVATLTPTFVKFLSCSITEKMCRETEGAMRDAHSRLWPDKKINRLFRGDFNVVVRERGALHLNVPGNACGLDPDHHRYADGDGYRLLPHNTDGSTHQLTLLVGLAKLHDIAKTFE